MNLKTLKKFEGSESQGYQQIKVAVPFLVPFLVFMASEIFMFGHSNGAKKAIALAAHNPDLFDGVVAHAGTLPIETKQGPQVNPYTGFKLGLLLGGRDHLFSIASARQTLRWLASMGMDSHLFVLNGHSHWYYDDAPQINALAWWYLNSDTDVVEARE